MVIIHIAHCSLYKQSQNSQQPRKSEMNKFNNKINTSKTYYTNIHCKSNNYLIFVLGNST